MKCLILSLVWLTSTSSDLLHHKGEKRLRNIRQLTFSGRNTEGYFSYDENYLTFQATGYGSDCDQIYRLDLRLPFENQTFHRLSTGIGSCTRSFFYPNNKDILYAGNFHKIKMNATKGSNDSTCPTKKCQSPDAVTDKELQNLCNTSYTWDIYPDYDIFMVNEYGNIIKQLTNNSVYNAEAVLNPDGTKILYTSMESGDLDLYIVNVDGTEKKQLTRELGYDGGGFFSSDGAKIVFRATRPDVVVKYKALLKYNLVDPTEMELYTINVDGTGYRPIFNSTLGGANWAPCYHPDNKRIIFSSNMNASTKDFNSFDLYLVNEDGTGLERITMEDSHFNSFPVFSRNGKQLIWSSSRNGANVDDVNLFVADWVDDEDLDGIEFHNSNKQIQLETNKIWNGKSSGQVGSPWENKKILEYDGVVHFKGEKFFRNVKQLTFGGQNAEGYFSFDDSKITLQATGYGTDCDQIYELDLNIDPINQTLRRISTGLGGTTCSYFFNETNNNHRLYAGNFWNVDVSSFENPAKTCPQKKCANLSLIKDPILRELCEASYTWDIVPDYDIFEVNKYGNIVRQLTDSPGYDAEAVVSPDGTKIAFTSIRSGDLELYIMNADGSNVTQITHEIGYDGGSFFSPDGKQLIFRASRPNTTREILKYKLLLEYNLVEPVAMELFIVNIDGSNMRQITNLGGANWAPYYLKDNKRIIFSSNYDEKATGFGAFLLYVINDDGTGLERVTYGKGQFDSFPMMNYAGTKLVWGSSRNGSSPYEMNLFIADWVDSKGSSYDYLIVFTLLLVRPGFFLNY